MPMKLKNVAAAAAISLCVTAPAGAVIGTGDSATLFLEVYDTAGTNATYVRDLGISLLDFGTQNRPTGGFNNIVEDHFTDAFAWATDATYASFVANASSTANLIWDVIAVDASGGSGPDQRRVVFTSLTDVVAVLSQPGVQMTNANLSIIQAIDSHIDGANASLGANTAAISSAAQAGTYNNSKGDILGGALSPALGVTTAGLGQSMGFYYMTRSSVSSTAEVAAAKYANGGIPFQWTLANDGTLTYGVAAIPEPSTMAMYLAGALMLGGFARRRKP
jgi:hypothetical protein